MVPKKCNGCDGRGGTCNKPMGHIGNCTYFDSTKRAPAPPKHLEKVYELFNSPCKRPKMGIGARAPPSPTKAKTTVKVKAKPIPRRRASHKLIKQPAEMDVDTLTLQDALSVVLCEQASDRIWERVASLMERVCPGVDAATCRKEWIAKAVPAYPPTPVTIDSLDGFDPLRMSPRSLEALGEMDTVLETFASSIEASGDRLVPSPLGLLDALVKDELLPVAPTPAKRPQSVKLSSASSPVVGKLNSRGIQGGWISKNSKVAKPPVKHKAAPSDSLLCDESLEEGDAHTQVQPRIMMHTPLGGTHNYSMLYGKLNETIATGKAVSYTGYTAFGSPV